MRQMDSQKLPQQSVIQEMFFLLKRDTLWYFGLCYCRFKWRRFSSDWIFEQSWKI